MEGRKRDGGRKQRNVSINMWWLQKLLLSHTSDGDLRTCDESVALTRTYDHLVFTRHHVTRVIERQFYKKVFVLKCGKSRAYMYLV